MPLEGGDQCRKDIATLLLHRCHIGANDAVGVCAFSRSKAARYFLLDFGHTHRLLGQIVRKRYVGLRHEAPNIVAVLAQPPYQVDRFALLGSPSLCAGQQGGLVRLAPEQRRIDRVNHGSYWGQTPISLRRIAPHPPGEL